ncbi:hypothetical protein Tco_1340327, partial [Tanacetum coccineum]
MVSKWLTKDGRRTMAMQIDGEWWRCRLTENGGDAVRRRKVEMQ